MHSKTVGLSKRRAKRYLPRIGTLQPKGGAARANSKIIAVVVALISNAMTLFHIAWQFAQKEKKGIIGHGFISMILSQTLAPGALSKYLLYAPIHYRV